MIWIAALMMAAQAGGATGALNHPLNLSPL